MPESSSYVLSPIWGSLRVGVNNIVLAQYADTFSELADPARVNQVDRRALAVKELYQLLVIDVGRLNNEGERLTG